MNPQEFSQKVKAKYPEYAQVPDDVLAQKVVEKYPQYKSVIQATPQPMAQAVPPQQQPPQGGGGGQPPFNPALQSAFYKAFPDAFKTQMMDQFDPMKQQELALKKAQTARYTQLAGGGGGKPPASVWMNPADPTDLSPVEKPGYIEYKTSSGDALNKFTGTAMGLKRDKVLGERAEAWQRSIDVKQVNELAKRTGITPKQQSSLQNNNMRADRAITILSNPGITWQELALGEIDLAGIMQGGVPQADELKNTHFPGWQQKWSQWKTYATGHPDESVPPDIREKVLTLVKGVKEIDNTYLNANANFSKGMLGPTIRGGLKRFDPTIDAMTKQMTSGDQKTGAYSDPDKEARYQAWKKANP